MLKSSAKLAAGWSKERFIDKVGSSMASKAKAGLFSRMNKINDVLSEDYLTERSRAKDLKVSVAEGLKLCTTALEAGRAFRAATEAVQLQLDSIMGRVWCGAVRGSVRCGAVVRGGVRCDAVLCCAVLCGGTLCCAVLCGAVWCCVVLCGAGAVRRCAMRCCTVKREANTRSYYRTLTHG